MAGLAMNINSQRKMNIDNNSVDHLYKCKYIFDKKKNRKLANIQASLYFYGMIILVKTKSLCRGMAWLPFQKRRKHKDVTAIGENTKMGQGSRT